MRQMTKKVTHEFKVYYVPQKITASSVEEFKKLWEGSLHKFVPPVEKVIQLEEDVTDITIKEKSNT